MDDKSQNLTDAKKNLYFELALFLILGFLLGVVIKTEAAKRITVGFNDYQVNAEQPVYSVNDLQKKLAEEQNQKQAGQQEQKNTNSNPSEQQ